MAEDSTRRLLRVFGIAVTDLEDALLALEAALRAEPSAGGPAAALEAHDRAARELEQRWEELGRLLRGWETRAREAVLAHVRAGGQG
jgi:hypothetical protein